MRRRAKDVGTSRPLRRFERRARPALDPRSLCSFGRHFLPVTEGWRLESESLKSLAVSLNDDLSSRQEFASNIMHSNQFY
jgi:hypothetical protein